MAVTFTLGTQFQVDANGGLARIATLTNTTAISLYSSAASGIEARFLTNSSGTITGGTVLTIDANQADGIAICRLSDTSAVIGYSYAGVHRTRVLTVSGTTLTANVVTNMTDTSVDAITCELLDTNKIIYCYSDSSDDGQSAVLTVSGTTITENAIFTFESGAAVHHCSVGIIDTGTAIVAYIASTIEQAQVLDISGTTITGNSSLSLTTVAANTGGNSGIDISMSISDSDFASIAFVTSGNQIGYQVISNSGGTLSREFGSGGLILESATGGASFNCCSLATYKTVDGADPGYDLVVVVSNDSGNDNLRITEYDNWNGSGNTDSSISTTAATTDSIHSRLFPGSSVGILDWNASTESIVVIFAAVLGLAPMTKPASINADGTFIYLALLDGGTPILTKIATDLLSDGTTVFNPGAGDNIGVECGRFNSDVIWVAGQFDGTNVVEKSEDGGSSFVVKDDATIGGVRSFVMGPDSDNRILLFDEDNGDILETRDGGESWTTVNASVTPEINAIARLGQNVEESVFGNDGGGSDSISYSVNSGDDLEDYQTGVYPATNATKVIVN